MPRLTRIVAYLQPDLAQRLDDLCEQTGASTTEIVRRALRQFTPTLGVHPGASKFPPEIERRNQPVLIASRPENA